MGLTRAVRGVLERLRDLGDGGLGPSREAAWVVEKLRGCRQRLEEARAEGDQLVARLAEQNGRAGQLAMLVKSFLFVADQPRAWEHALTLEELRRHVDGDRALLHHCRQRQQALLGRIQELEARLRDLEARLDDA